MLRIQTRTHKQNVLVRAALEHAGLVAGLAAASLAAPDLVGVGSAHS
jgi:hypothetical protein